MTTPGPVPEADALADALLSDDPRTALDRLDLHDDALLAVRTAALRRLHVVHLRAGSPTARVLLAVCGHPGLSLAELAALPQLVDVEVADAGRQLAEAGLVTSSRFSRTDCWARTAAGAEAAARLRVGEQG